MRFIYFMSVFALCSLPFQASGQNPVEQICDTAPSQLQLVGFTGATFLGAEGMLAYNLACQAEFPETRMCQSFEVAETVMVPASLDGTAWVRPTFVPTGSSSLEAISGRGGFAGEVFTCTGYTNPTGRGLTVDPAGRFDIGMCNVLRPVACCGLP